MVVAVMVMMMKSVRLMMKVKISGCQGSNPAATYNPECNSH